MARLARVIAPGFPTLSPIAATGAVGDWGRWLAEPEQGETTSRLRLCTKTGRPCGTPAFVASLEESLGRLLSQLKCGPKPRLKTGDEGQAALSQTRTNS